MVWTSYLSLGTSVLGTAGTGKSYLINTFSNLLGNNCILTGTTGMAGYNIQGCTVHSAVQLPVRNYNNNELQGAALQRLQLRFSGKHYLILDEMSMLGQRTLAWLDKRLRQATGKLHVPLGGISVLLLGDFGQLPPVGDRAIYSPPFWITSRRPWPFHLYSFCHCSNTHGKCSTSWKQPRSRNFLRTSSQHTRWQHYSR